MTDQRRDSYHRDHWIEVSEERKAAYEEMFRWRPEMEPLLAPAGLEPRQRVLDVGCGPGQLSVELARRVAPDGHVTGVDINPDFVARTNARAAAEGLAAQLEAVEGGEGTLPFADDSFDRVLCKSVLEYVADPAATVVEMRRVARPGGLVHVVDSDWRMLALEPVGPARSAALFDAARFAYRTPHIGRLLPGLFRQAGLTDVNVAVYASPDLSGRRAPIVRNMADYAREFGQMDEAEIAAIEAEVEQAIADGSYLFILPQFVVTGTA